MSAYLALGNGLYIPGTVLTTSDGEYVDASNRLPVDATGTVDVTQDTVPWVVGGVGGTLTVDDGGITLSIDDGAGSITVDGTFWQATQPVSIAATVAVSGPLTDAQLRATPVPVSGSFTVDSEITTADLD